MKQKLLQGLLGIIVIMSVLQTKTEGASLLLKGKYVGTIYSQGFNSTIVVSGKITGNGTLVLKYISGHPCLGGMITGKLNFSSCSFCTSGGRATAYTGICTQADFIACGEVNSTHTQLIGEWSMPTIGDSGTFVLQRK